MLSSYSRLRDRGPGDPVKRQSALRARPAARATRRSRSPVAAREGGSESLRPRPRGGHAKKDGRGARAMAGNREGAQPKGLLPAVALLPFNNNNLTTNNSNNNSNHCNININNDNNDNTNNSQALIEVLKVIVSGRSALCRPSASSRAACAQALPCS